MAKPSSKDELIDYALRKLGAPVIEINVDREQAEDRLDGRDIVSVIKVFQFGALKGISSMFDVRYQMALSDYFGINTGLGYQSSLGLASFDSAKRYISMIEDFFQAEKEIRFSKVTNRLLIDSELDKTANAGDFIIIEAYAALNPDKFTEIYNDRLFKKYVTALIKKQWGTNLSKFAGVQLPGGVQLNGPQIYAEAISEIQIIEQEFYSQYELPIDFIVA